jgi:hypothetical protein
MITDLSIPIKEQALNSFADVFGVYSNASSPTDSTLERMDLLVLSYVYSKERSFKIFLLLFDSGCRANLDYYDHDLHFQQFRKPDHFALLQAQSPNCEVIHKNPTPQNQRLGLPRMHKIFNGFEQDPDFADMNVQSFQKTYAYYVLEFFSSKHRHYPKHPNFKDSETAKMKHYMDAATEKELVACDKSIFVAESKDLRTEFRYLMQNYPQIRFYLGNNSMEQGMKGKVFWNFWKIGNSKLPYYLRLLLQAGIRDAVLSIQTHKRYLQRRIGTKFIKESMPFTNLVDMSGPTQTVFYILFTVHSLAGFQFVFELIYCNRKRIYELSIYLVVISIARSRIGFAIIFQNVMKCLHIK